MSTPGCELIKKSDGGKLIAQVNRKVVASQLLISLFPQVLNKVIYAVQVTKLNNKI